MIRASRVEEDRAALDRGSNEKVAATIDIADAMQLELAHEVTTDGKATVQLRGELDIATADRAFAYLCDVFVLESHQGKGLGAWMMQCVLRHPDLQGLRRWHLTTRDAHELYRKVGFVPLSKPERHMELFTPDIYQRHQSRS